MKYVGRDSKEKIVERFARYVNPGKADTFKSYGMEFVFGSREGPYVWDAVNGKRLINCHCNGGVFNLGHRHPEIIRVLKDSLEELDIGNHHFVSEQRSLLAEKLARLMPGDIDCTVFGVGGGEAIDLAIKLARGYTGKFKIISALGGYHGHTGFALATGDEQYRAPFGPNLPGFAQVPFNDAEALRQAVDEGTAAVIFETIPATLGMPVPHPGYYSQVQEICREKGALLIIDEVQTGLGRTGKLWGIEHFGVTPDIIVIGKGLSGGIYPISATCFRSKYMEFFRTNPFIHVSTFGGAEVGCPVAAVVLDISSQPRFLAHVAEIAGVFKEGFAGLKKKHPYMLVGLRQLGLMMGIEMVNDSCGPLMTKACYERGVLALYANNDKRVCQLLPPLTIDRQTALEIIECVDLALKDTADFLGLK